MPKLDTNKYFTVLINIVLIVIILLGLALAKYLWKQVSALQPSRTITVSAEGKTVVVPDIAKINFSLVTEGKDPMKVQLENTEKANKAIDFVKTQGIDEKDIKTASYNLSPRYDYDRKTGRSTIYGYELRQSVEVKIRDFDKIPTVLGALPEMGINEISQLQFDVDKPDEYLNQARKEAFEKARAKAEAMTEQNGVRIRRVISFSDFSGGYPGPVFFEKTALSIGGDAAPAPTIEPGSQEVSVQVNVTYEIR